MSRTYAHVPVRVELERVTDKSILKSKQRTWVPGRGFVSHSDPESKREYYVPHWASTQTWTRHGTFKRERRSSVRIALGKSAKEYRTNGIVEEPNLPGPETFCLCQLCGVY